MDPIVRLRLSHVMFKVVIGPVGNRGLILEVKSSKAGEIHSEVDPNETIFRHTGIERKE